MKTKNPRRIGRLAEAKLQIQALAELVAEATAIHIKALVEDEEFYETHFKKYDSSGFPVEAKEVWSEQDRRDRDLLWARRHVIFTKIRNAEDQVREAKVSLREAEIRLAEILDQMRLGAPTVTATSKNRVPFVSPEMECDWDEVQNTIANQADERQFAKWRKSSSVDNPQCKCCRRMKARINANSKPSKAHK